MANRPGGELATRPLHFIWICDCSGSMDGDKISALNTAIKEAYPAMKDAAEQNPNAQVLVRALKFSSGAEWVIEAPTPVENFRWVDLNADGVTDMGKALSLVADQLKIPPMSDRALPPVLVLISDGQPTDDFETGLNNLMGQPWGKRSVRIAIAVGSDADKDVLTKFIGNPELKPIEVLNAPELVRQIRWVSTAVLKAASQPPSQTPDQKLSSNVPLPPPLEPNKDADIHDVW